MLQLFAVRWRLSVMGQLRLAVRNLLIGGGAFALAGCGTMTMTSGRDSVASPASVISRAFSPQQRAKADAAAILAAFVPPPGARRLTRLPGGLGGELDHREALPIGDPDFVANESAWEVRGGSPLRVLTWEKAHLPSRFLLMLRGGEAVPQRPLPPGMPPPGRHDPYHYASYGFDLPGVTGILIQREMIVQAARSLAGKTYVRVDAEVMWQPQRPASERVPAGVRAITITARSYSRPYEVPAPVTITDPAGIGKIVALIDRLFLDTPGTRSCPLENRKIMLSFLSQANGPVLATASEPIASCGDVQFTVLGKHEPPLSDFGSFSQEVLSIAGVRWQGFNLPAPVPTP